MALDSAANRASATMLFPQAKAVWPAAAVDRIAAAWVYSGLGAEVNPAPGRPVLATLTTHRAQTPYTLQRGYTRYTTRTKRVK